MGIVNIISVVFPGFLGEYNLSLTVTKTTSWFVSPEMTDKPVDLPNLFDVFELSDINTEVFSLRTAKSLVRLGWVSTC